MRIAELFKTSYCSWSGTFIRNVEDKCRKSDSPLMKMVMPRVAALALLVILPLELIVELPATILIAPLFVDSGGSTLGRNARNSLGTVATLVKSVATLVTGNLPEVGYKLYHEGVNDIMQELVVKPLLSHKLTKSQINTNLQMIFTLFKDDKKTGIAVAMRGLVIEPALTHTLTHEQIRANLIQICTRFKSITDQSECDDVGEQLASIAKKLGSGRLPGVARVYERDNVLGDFGIEIIERVLVHQQGLPSRALLEVIIEQGLLSWGMPLIQRLMQSSSSSVTSSQLLNFIKDIWEDSKLGDVSTGESMNGIPFLELLVQELLKKPDLKGVDIQAILSIPVIWTMPNTMTLLLPYMEKKAVLNSFQQHSNLFPVLAKYGSSYNKYEDAKKIVLSWMLKEYGASNSKEEVGVIFVKAIGMLDLDVIQEVLTKYDHLAGEVLNQRSYLKLLLKKLSKQSRETHAKIHSVYSDYSDQERLQLQQQLEKIEKIVELVNIKLFKLEAGPKFPGFDDNVLKIMGSYSSYDEGEVKAADEKIAADSKEEGQ